MYNRYIQLTFSVRLRKVLTLTGTHWAPYLCVNALTGGGSTLTLRGTRDELLLNLNRLLVPNLKIYLFLVASPHPSLVFIVDTRQEICMWDTYHKRFGLNKSSTVVTTRGICYRKRHGCILDRCMSNSEQPMMYDPRSNRQPHSDEHNKEY